MKALLLGVLALVFGALGLHSAGSTARSPAGIRSIWIHRAGGAPVDIRDPTEVAKIASWFAALPPFVARPCPYVSYTPPTVTFVFHRPGAARKTAVDHAPGTCFAEIERGRGKALADNGFVARVSRLLGVSFDPNARTERNIAAAKLDAAQHLELVRVPSHSRPFAKPRPPRVYRAYIQADANRTWRVRLPYAEALAFEKTHPPRGSSLYSADSDSTPHGITLRYVFRPIAHRLSGRALYVEIVPLAGGWTRIAVVAFTTWVMARSLNEKVPAGVRQVVVQGTSRRVRIKDPERVARIVRWFNALRPARPDRPWRCNANTAFYTPPFAAIDFVGARGAKLATAGTEWCDGSVTFSVAGHDEAPLAGGFTVREVERLSR